MPKKIEDLTESDVLEYYVCTICKLLYLLNETATYDFKLFCQCKTCMAQEREKVMKEEEDNIKKLQKEKLRDIMNYIRG